MARSVGEAVSNGLESGLNLGLGIATQRANQERQARLDAQQVEDRNRLISRQNNADQGAALNEQEKQLAVEGQGLADATTPPSAEVQQDFTARVQGLKQAKSAHLAQISGYDVDAVKKAAKVDIDQLTTGDVGSLKPGQLTRALTVATGQNPSVYIRPQGGMAPIEQAGQDLIDGIQSGDQNKALAGANLMFAPHLQKGVGQPSPHGGVILKKEIVGLQPVAGSENDPKFVPILRVYVDKGQGFTGPRDPATGASSYYDAPLTDDRGSKDSSKLKILSQKDALDFVGHNLHVAELLNQPEGLAKLQEDQQAGDFNPQEYLSALQRLGVQAQPKVNIKETVIPAGGTLKRTVTNARTGAIVSESTTQGNTKVNPADKLTMFSDGIDKQVEQGVMSEEEGSQLKSDFATRQARGSGDATIQAKLQAVEDDSSLSEADKAVQRKAILSGIKPGKEGTGAAGGGDARASDRKLGRQLQVVKDQRIELDSARKHALDEFKAATHDANKKDTAAAKVIYDGKIKALESQDADLKARLKKINDQLDEADTPAPAPSPAAAPAPRGANVVSTADQAARDKDAGRVLRDEMTAQQAKLGTLTDPVAIERKRGDIAALQREIDRTGRPGLASARPAAGAAPSPAPAKPGLVLKFDKQGNRVSN